jgi:hypothetical protein
MINCSHVAARLAPRLAGFILLALTWSACTGPSGEGNEPSGTVEDVRAALTSGGVQINCGGPLVEPFLADDNFSGGSPRTRTNTIDMSAVYEPAPMAVYQSQRFGDFTYTFNGFIPAAFNTIRLHFADTHWTTPGSRSFNVSINGSVVLQDFDIIATVGAGNKAYVAQFSLPADSSGRYVIQFTTVVDAATVSGIEIQPSRSQAGAWSHVNASMPTGLASSNRLQMTLLTDGSVMCMMGTNGIDWYKLTPDVKGKYENGTWSQLASSHNSIIFNPSTMLKDGRYMIGGGEYVVGTNRSSMDIYDPVSDTWFQAAQMPQDVADTGASITPDGRFLVGANYVPYAYLYDPSTNAWTQTGDNGTGTGGGEQGWTILQTGAILAAWNPSAIFDSTANAWSATGAMPDQLVDAQGEIGPTALLPSGKVMVFGGYDSTAGGPFAHTAIYDPPSNTWTQGPNAPDGLQWGDTGGTVMANGHVLVASSPNNTSGGGATQIWEFDPLGQAGGTFTVIADNSGTFPNTPKINFPLFLNLPNGQILVGDSVDPTNLYIYTPQGVVGSDSWRPAISSVSSGVGGVFVLKGTQLNGLTTGSTFGDDRNSGSNYPIVSLTDSAGNVFHARTYNFDQMAPLTGWSGSCQFTLPPSIPNGTYNLSVSASGAASSGATALTVSGNHVKSVTGANVAPNGSANWTVTLAAAAAGSGTVVKLSSDNTAVVTVPATVTVSPGSTTATFAVKGKAFGFAHITADLQTPNAQFMPVISNYGWRVNSIFDTALNSSFVVPSLMGPTDKNTTFVLTLSAPAPSGGVVVNLASSEPGAGTVPASVTVPSGSRTVNFTVTRGATLTGGHSIISTALVGDSKANTLDSYLGTAIPATLPLL